jgi:hypothetical protein
MVAAGDYLHAGGEDFLRRGGRDTRTTGGIFPVGDDQMNAVLLPQFRNEFPYGTPARLPHDVADEKNLHWRNSNWRGGARKQNGRATEYYQQSGR